MTSPISTDYDTNIPNPPTKRLTRPSRPSSTPRVTSFIDQ